MVGNKKIFSGIKMIVRPFRPVLPGDQRAFYHCYLRISFINSFFEKLETFGVFLAVILTADLYIFQVERFRMSLFGTHSSESRIDRRISVSNSIQGILYQFVHGCDIFITRTTTLARHTAVDHIQRFSFQVFTHLQIFMISHPVCRTIRPYIPEMLTFRNISDCFTPDRICPGSISFHEASSRKTNKLWIQRGNLFHKIRAQSIRPVIPCFLGK